ncbi:diguanylate cyclase domain-containing protein [Desulfocurvus vexinensis]|uniref:diguanylate cyclase domain-containing protein n=1 Tax=Desulfocurvus vexinensis TaxID=399548 RepID=UPI0004B35E96|nr:diguanylate cyclase [Desulfocurvus vexinensis]
MNRFLKHLLAVAAYLAAAHFAQALAPQPGQVAPVWPAAGVGFSALFVLGPAALGTVLAADLAASLLAGVGPGTALALALCNALGLGLGALLARRTLGDKQPFDGPGRMGHFLVFGPLLASLLAALAGVLVLERGGALSAGSAQAAWSWFLSDFTGMVVIAPLVVAWRRHPPGLPPMLRHAEGALLLLGMAVAALVVFGLHHGEVLRDYPLIFAFIPVMAWATFRADSRTLTLLLALLFPVSGLATHAGLGPFGHLPQPMAMHVMQVFFTVTVATALVIHALSRERNRTTQALADSRAALRTAHAELERRVTERTAKLDQALRELRDAEETYRTLFENAEEGIYRADASGRMVRVNPGLARMLGYESPERLMGQTSDIWRQIFVGEDSRRKLYETLATRGQATDFEMPVRKQSGEQIWVSMSVRPVMDPEGHVLGIEGIVQDITQRKLSEEELRRRATQDPLTGVANRHTFERTLRRMLAQAARGGPGLALLFIDLDDFKAVNDTHGHLAGDHVLRAVAARVQGRLREVDLLARMGGDEFALLLHNVSDAQAADAVARDILRALAEPVEFEGRRLTVGASVGGCLASSPADTVDDLLQRADKAMYRAKQQGKNRSHIEAA